MTSEDPFTYPGTKILRNRFHITDQTALDRVERRLVANRAAEGIPAGQFDLPHLCAIHRHLFRDVYAWAGQPRTVEIARGGHQFMFVRFIESGMADIHRRLAAADYLRGLRAAAFAHAAGMILGDVNYIHPFREGNGRTQLFYLAQLAEQAGHPLDLTRLDPRRWIAASRAAHDADYAPMAEEIMRALAGRG